MIRTEQEVHQLDQQETDSNLPTAWKSGSLKYDDLKPLAEGGTARLFLTNDQNLGRTVAYKTLHSDLCNSEVENKRFLREARVTANIQHPGTLPVYELGRDRSGQLFFTMKKVDGRDLRKILHDLAQEVPEVVDDFPLPRLLDILIQVCQTIAYAHDLGVIHRDLKPANIIVGRFGEVYVLDWGLAKITGSTSIIQGEYTPEPEKKDLQLTPVGRHYGTPMYMSPEIAKGDENIDGRSDVFSLGIILFEMLTLQSFIEGEDIIEIKKKLLDRPYPMPRERVPSKHLPKDLEAVCMRSLKRERTERYQKVSELLADLQSYRHGEMVSVYWYSGWEKLIRWNNRKAYWLIAIICTLAGAGLHALLGR